MDLKKAAKQAYVNSLTQDLTDWDKIELQLEEIEEMSAELEEKSKELLKSIEAFKRTLIPNIERITMISDLLLVG